MSKPINWISSLFWLSLVLLPSYGWSACEQVTHEEKPFCLIVHASSFHQSCETIKHDLEQVLGAQSTDLHFELCQAFLGLSSQGCESIPIEPIRKLCLDTEHRLLHFQPNQAPSEVPFQLEQWNDVSEIDVDQLSHHLRYNYPRFLKQLDTRLREGRYFDSFIARHQLEPGLAQPGDFEAAIDIALELRALRVSREAQATLPPTIYSKRGFSSDILFSYALELVLAQRRLAHTHLPHPITLPAGTLIESYHLPTTLITDGEGHHFLKIDVLLIPQNGALSWIYLKPLQKGTSKHVWLVLDNQLKLKIIGHARANLNSNQKNFVSREVQTEFNVRSSLPAHLILNPQVKILQHLPISVDHTLVLCIVDEYGSIQFEKAANILSCYQTIDGKPMHLIKSKLAQIATDSVSLVHDAGLCHRDIKADNFVFKWNNGWLIPRLIDHASALDLGLGVDQESQAGNDDSHARDPRVRESITPFASSFAGTEVYCSPEACRSLLAGRYMNSAQNDVWALGLTLYSLTMNPNNERGTLWDGVYAVQQIEKIHTYADLQQVLGIEFEDDLSPVSLELVIKKMLNPDPDERITARQALLELKAVFKSQSDQLSHTTGSGPGLQPNAAGL